MQPDTTQDAAAHQARNFSSRLGLLAAELSPTQTRRAGLPTTDPVASIALPGELAALLGRLAQRHRARDEAMHNLRAHEFIMAD